MTAANSPPGTYAALVKDSTLWRVAGFTACYLLASAFVAASRGNREFVFYLVVMCLLAGCVADVHRRVGLSQALLWCMSGWGLMHMAGGLLPVPERWPINGETRVLYSLWLIPGWLKYDQITHAFGFGVTTWLCWQGLRRVLATRSAVSIEFVRPTFGMLLLCTAGGMGFGAMNEIVEFVATLLVPETNVGGYVNTGWDLVANLAGCVIAASLIASWRR